ncbi:type I DNA topoisomerase [Spongiibacter taiwanensis]|uniref:type I DNA topoisomerase n=1 Tax=Spongiibacter taiwanensis TaxID=1748242 RepID=UPI002036197D|nr:type I DNA topoisomerase [Spongiibacter taiwanensis]USA43541.1 type I DNA topoisomerase [Spongiibacter taiwanensis]
MAKSLVIVESPAKAKTINKYLGADFVVKSSVGHIRDLPTSGSNSKPVDPKARAKAAAETRKMSAEQKEIHKKKKAKQQLVSRMGVDPENGWAAHYEILPGKEKVVSELKKLAEKADTIYLATDLDREGEAIAWHLREAIGGDESRYRRVVFNEITKKAIKEAFERPAELDIDRVNAQQARRFLDRVVGYMVSPLLWAKIARGLSAGRVQSVAVRLIVEREKEIRAFVPEEYWQVFADTKADAGALRLEVKKQGGENFRPGDETSAMAAVAALQESQFEVAAREDKPTRSKPGAPYITSTLQQAASTRLGFGVKKTMMLAQRLYEAGYITYMRTDSTNLSQEAVQACREYIGNNFAKAYLPDAPLSYSSKEGAQEAHEAIRPSDVNVQPTQLQGMERDAERLYTLIWRQFVACQMAPAEFTSTSVVVNAGDFELRTRGRVVRFDGFMAVQPPMQSKKDEDQVLPDVKVGDALKLVKVDPSQHFTKPAPRYSEAALVKELEKRGIGRPSTYASIISTIQDRGYVKVESRRFYAEKMGDIVTDRLVESFSNLLDYGFTARMEESLDSVASGDKDWKKLLDEFYSAFQQALETAEADGPKGMRSNQPTETDISCPNCSRPMQIRTASTGVFLGCSGYALPPKERCKQTINLVPGEEFVSIDSEDDEAESKVLRSKHRCKICNAAMESYLIDEGRKLHICGNNPDCAGFEIEKGAFKIKGYEGPTIECDKCGSEMQLKTGRFGKYFGCTSESCKNTRKLLKNGEPAPPKMDPVDMPELQCEKVDDHYVLRDGASGLFLAASGFPRNRETRAPLVKEILPHKAEIDPKYTFLFSAPVQDDEGRDTVIRYSRKSKEQYVQSEVDGKPSGWSAFYEGGKWQVRDKNAKAKKSAK